MLEFGHSSKDYMLKTWKIPSRTGKMGVGGSFRRQDLIGGNESQDCWLQNVHWYLFLILPSVQKEASHFIPLHLLHHKAFFITSCGFRSNREK